MARDEPTTATRWMVVLALALLLVLGAIAWLVLRADPSAPGPQGVADLPSPKLPDVPNPQPTPVPLPRPAG